MLNLVNFVTGKAAVWVVGVLAAVVLGMSGWVYMLKADVKRCEAEIREAKAEQRAAQSALDIQNSIIEANRAEYEASLKVAKEQKQKVKVEYKERVQIIEKWREINATCPNAMRYLNTYTF